MSSTTINPDMETCIDNCQNCHQVCWQMATTHCLELGGKHIEPSHLKLMLNCAEICQTAANFMLSESEYHSALCGVCADVCEACADSCEQMGDMDVCVQACRQCTQSCQIMNGGGASRRSTAGTETTQRM